MITSTSICTFQIDNNHRLMNTISVHNPNKITFGNEAVEEFLNDFLAINLKRLYILTLPAMLSQLAFLFSTLEKKGISVFIDTSIKNEPSLKEFEDCLNSARKYEADSILGIGGGSILDVSKLLAALLRNDQKIQNVIGIGNLKERSTYLACMPTTAGTGSEVSPNAIFKDSEGNKKGVISPFLVPDAAYVCPKLTLTVPPDVTAATGIDALTHCLEAYANKFAHPLIDLIALQGIRLISSNLVTAYQDGSNLEARTNVLLGSLYGGMCLGPVNTAAVHALAYPLGTIFNIPHGLSNAILLPYVMSFNLPFAIERYAEIAIALGAPEQKSKKQTAEDGIKKIKALNEACNIPQSLSELGIPESSIDGMAQSALEVTRLLKNNLRSVTLEDAKSIYAAAL